LKIRADSTLAAPSAVGLAGDPAAVFDGDDILTTECLVVGV
jgi:hypothetical protein